MPSAPTASTIGPPQAPPPLHVMLDRARRVDAARWTAEAVARFRERRGWTGAELGRRCGLDNPSQRVSDIENGRRTVPGSVAVLLTLWAWAHAEDVPETPAEAEALTDA